MSLTLDGPLLALIIGLPLVIPFVIGIILWVGFPTDELHGLISLFTLKPVLAYPIWFYITTNIEPVWHDNWIDDVERLFGGWLALIPAIILTIGITLTFRKMFTQQLAWIFLYLDILRMLNTFILSSSDGLDYFSAPFGLVLPSLIAILALIIVGVRDKKMNSALTSQ